MIQHTKKLYPNTTNPTHNGQKRRKKKRKEEVEVTLHQEGCQEGRSQEEKSQKEEAIQGRQEVASLVRYQAKDCRRSYQERSQEIQERKNCFQEAIQPCQK